MGRSKKNVNGSGSTRKKGNIYEYRFYDNSGVRHSKYAKTQEELKEVIRKVSMQLYNGDFKAKSTLTFQDIYQDIIEEKKSNNIIKENTYMRHIELLKILQKFNFANIKIQRMQNSDIKILYANIQKHNYSQSVIDKINIAINQVLNKSIELNIISKNFNTGIIKPRSNKKTKDVTALTIEEQKKLLNIIDNSRYKIIYLIALYTGLRIGEINALTLRDIDLNNRVIHVNKTVTKNINNQTIVGEVGKTTNATRNVTIIDILYLPLYNYIKDLNISDFNALVFTNSKGLVLSTSAINSEFKRLNKKYNFCNNSVNVHMLRHTFATRCIESGITPVVLKDILGHADIKTTLNTYTSVFSEFKNTEISKLENYIKTNINDVMGV